MAIECRKTKGRVSEEGLGLWTNDEHKRFTEAMELYPKGPWKLVAEYVGTRNARQTMTHAQKHRQKQERHQRGLRTKSKALPLDQELTSSATARQRRPIKALTQVAPLCGYESPKEVSNHTFDAPAGLSFCEAAGLSTICSTAVTTGTSTSSIDMWLAQMTGQTAYSLVPLADLATEVDSQALEFEDCLDYFLESFS